MTPNIISKYASPSIERCRNSKNPNHIDHPISLQNVVGDWTDDITKEKVILYMATISNDRRCITSTRPAYKDLFSEEKIPAHGSSIKDAAGWYWTDEAIYYADVYNIVPEPDFIDHVLEEYEKGFVPEQTERLLRWRVLQ